MTTKTVHYRKFDPKSDEWKKGTLHSILDATLKAIAPSGQNYLNDFDARRINVQGTEQLIRFSHNFDVSETYIFGTLCLFLKDDWAIVLREYEDKQKEEHKSLDAVMRQLEIAERPPTEGEDFLRGIAYWLVVGDHLFVVQHTSIQTKAFEEYFFQLFTAANILSISDEFGLRAEFNKDTVGGDLDNISAVQVGGIVNRGSAPETLKSEITIDVDTEEQKTIGRSLTRFEKAIDVLKAVFGDPNAEKILKELPPEAELEVDVRFGYKSKKRGTSRQVLRDIASAARNLPDGEVVAIGKDGKQIGDDLRLSAPMPFTLVRPNGVLLDLEDARTKLLRVYHRFVEDNKIDV